MGAYQGIVTRGFRDRFPTLAELPIASFWGGWIAMTLNFLPSIGPLGKDGTLWHALGYNGHGVAQATAVGDILAAGIMGRDNEWARVFPKPTPTLPPEPFLWLTAHGLLALFGTLDRVTDRQIRTRRYETPRSTEGRSMIDVAKPGRIGASEPGSSLKEKAP